jgi:hypothetical protein
MVLKNNIIKTIKNIRDIIPPYQFNIFNKNILFITFLIYTHFFNQKLLGKLGKFLSKSSSSFIVKIGERISTSSEYHRNKLEKIPTYLKIIDMIVMFYFWGFINSSEKINLLSGSLFSLIIYLGIFTVYFYKRNSYYKSI